MTALQSVFVSLVLTLIYLNGSVVAVNDLTETYLTYASRREIIAQVVDGLSLQHRILRNRVS